MQDDIGWVHWIGKDYWSNRQAADPWELCALSVGIEAKCMTADRTDYSIGPGVSVVWGPQPTREKQITLGEFERRLNLLCHDKDDSRFFTVRNDGKLFLHEFVAWMKARDIRDFPWELAKLDAKPVECADRKHSTVVLDESETNTYRHLQKYESGIAALEAKPPSVPKPKRTRGVVAPAIERAIKTAGSTETGAVLLELRKLAIAKEAPFTGDTPGDGGLLYRDHNNQPAKYTREALRGYLRRRILPASPLRS
jgi:hypothetical protein